jgi:bidirectional [NiFe] hydrogenase diaphorase subunit
MTETVTVTIDGLKSSAEKGTMLLRVIRGMGILVPTLCHHPSLEPTGSCRLCVVEITHSDWKGWSGLVTSCLYPVEPGLIVSTRSERVTAARRTLLEMYLARCPEAEIVRELAHAEGVDDTPYPVTAEPDKCVLCGLCVRVCQDFGPGAISALGRGSGKTVGPRPDGTGEECVGCGACALVCPTDEIVLDRKPGMLSIWKREFHTPPYSVDGDACRGCGACEEVCPLSIPRVVARRAGTFTAAIAPDACVSCGLCAGVCPTGAVVRSAETPCSPETADALDPGSTVCAPAIVGSGTGERGVEGRGVGGRGVGGRGVGGRMPVIACARSVLPADVEALPVPCVGRVTVEILLEKLARGADGVLVLGRDKATCAFGPGEDMAAARVDAAAGLAAMAGLGRDRVRFDLPPAGYDGPARACTAFRESLRPSPLKEPFRKGGFPVGYDGALAILDWLLAQPELEPRLPADVEALFPAAGETDTILYLGDLLFVDRLLSLIIREKRLFTLVEDAAALLDLKGIVARPVMTAREVAESKAARLVVFDDAALPDFGRSIEVVTLDSLAGAGTGGPPAASGDAVLRPFRFRIGGEERSVMAEALGASTLICTSPHQVAQFMLLARDGTWQTQAPPEPLMAFQENVRAAREEVVS